MSTGESEDRSMPHLRLAAGASVRRADGGVKPLAALDAAMLAYLALEGPTSRQRLLQLLWPEQAAESARNALRQRLFRLRKALDADVVQGSELLSLVPEVTHDLAGGASELLAGEHYEACAELDEWLGKQRGARAAAWRERLVAEAEVAEREGRLADAVRLATELLANDALQEHAHRRLMRLHYLRGDRAAAVAAFERCERVLKDELGVAPGAETLALLDTIESARAATPALPGKPLPAAIQRPPRLIGRDAELAAMRVAAEAGRVLVLLGEAGMGKSRLIGDFFGAFGGDDGTSAALIVSARPGDAGVPYATLGRALRQLIQSSPKLLAQEAQRGELARVVPELDNGGAAAQGAARDIGLHAAIESLFHDAFRGGIASVVVDDLHFADPASLEMLQALVLGDSLPGLGWAFALRPGEPASAVSAMLSALEESHRVEPIVLQPLDEARMAELVDSLGLHELDAARLAPMLVRHTGGNPMYALETLKHLMVTGRHALDDGLPRPANVSQLIGRRLRQLTAPALALARVAAIAGVDFSIELAEKVLRTHALALADVWRELEVAQVLRHDAFAHDLVYESTIAGIPAPIAARTHAEVAAFLEAGRGEPARIASHWIAAGQPRRALAALHASAGAARHSMRRKEEAAFLLQAARVETEHGDPAAFDSLRCAIEALWVSDRSRLGAAEFDRLEALATTQRQLGMAYALRASWANETNDSDEAKRLCQRAIDIADAAGDQATSSDARLRLGQILNLCGDYAAAVALMHPLHAWFAERADDESKLVFNGDLATALDNADRGREARIFHARAITIGRQIGAWSDVVTVLGNLAISWANAGHMQRAVELLNQAMQLAAAHDEARGCAATLPIELHNTLRDAARYADALQWAEPAMAAVEGQLAAWKPLVLCHRACTWIHLGQHARAHHDIAAALTVDAPNWMRAKAFQMQSRMALAMGRSADASLEQADALAPRDGRHGLRASIALDHALPMEPGAALRVARDVIAQGQRLETPGVELAGHVRAMRFAVLAADAEAALHHAQAVMSMSDDIAAGDLYPGERWLCAWQALRLGGHDAQARDALRRGGEWVLETKATHVPELFRDSFVRANPVNQQILRHFVREGFKA